MLWLWCCRRLLRVPWTARKSNQSIPKEIGPGCSLEGMMLKLKLQYFGHSCEELTHWKRLWCWEGLGAEGEGDYRGWDRWMASPMWWTWVWVDSGSWWWTGRPGVLQFMGLQRARHDWVTELYWTEPTPVSCLGKSMHRRVWWATVHGVPRVGHDWDTHVLVVWPLFCVFLVLYHSTNCFHYFWLLSLSHILSCWLLCSFPFVFYLPIFKVYSMVIKRGWYT